MRYWSYKIGCLINSENGLIKWRGCTWWFVGLLVWALLLVIGLVLSLFNWACWTNQNRGGRGHATGRQDVDVLAAAPVPTGSSPEFRRNRAVVHRFQIRGYGEREEGEGISFRWLRA